MPTCTACLNLSALCYSYLLDYSVRLMGGYTLWFLSGVQQFHCWLHIKESCFLNFICHKILMTPAVWAVCLRQWIRARIQLCVGSWVGRWPGFPIIGHSSPGRSKGSCCGSVSTDTQRWSSASWHTVTAPNTHQVICWQTRCSGHLW